MRLRGETEQPVLEWDLVRAAGRRVSINRLVSSLAVAGMCSEQVRGVVKMWVDLKVMEMDGDYVVMVRDRYRVEGSSAE